MQTSVFFMRCEILRLKVDNSYGGFCECALFDFMRNVKRIYCIIAHIWKVWVYCKQSSSLALLSSLCS